MFDESISEKELKFNELEKKIFKFVCKLGCFIIKIILEKYDRKLMNERDKKKYRHKGVRRTTIKTVMGEVEYQRVMYEIEVDGIKKRVYLLDETLHINAEGQISENVIEEVVEIVPKTVSYRKAEETMKATTNIALSHETIRKIILKVGNKISEKEKEEIKLYKEEKLVAGEKITPMLFEETDGIWVNLQGKDRKKRLEENRKNCEKANKEFDPNMKIKTEMKFLVTYEGWEKGNKRHALINKMYMTGENAEQLREIRDAKVYQEYDVEKIKARAINGDGAKWTEKMTPKKGVYQKDKFHIMEKIKKNVPEEHQNIIVELINKKEYEKVPEAIEGIKKEINGEEKGVKKLDELKRYLSSGLERYQDKIDVPKAPDGIEYRNMGTQECHVFSKFKVRLCSGRKAFSEKGLNALAQICIIDEKFSMEELETPVPIDTSVEEWINALEANVKANLTRKDSFITKEKGTEGIGVHIVSSPSNIIKEILKYQDMSEIQGIY